MYYCRLLDQLKEVLRREIQGLKVLPVYRYYVCSMTGTYFWFIWSLLSGFIFKKMPEAGTLFWCHCSFAQKHFQDSLLSGLVIFRLKHSIGTALAAWRVLAECHLFYDLRVQDPPTCDATGDQNHRSIPLWEQPAVRWCTGLLFRILWHPALLTLPYWPGRQSLEYF